MSKNTKKLVPKLRFPEFRDAGTWQQLRLDEIASRVSLKNKNGQVIRVLTNSAADGIVDQRDYFEKDIAVQGNLEGYYVVNNGDYVYNPRVSNLAPVGPISKNKLATGVMSPLYSVFRFKDSDNSFYEQYFKTPNWHLYLRKISNSGARHDRMAITTDDFMSMPLPAPAPKEQQKIADCLSSIDDLITAQSQKVEALKTHKKGLMQQLFPREGETVPRLRFPEFRNAGEWEEKELRNFSECGLSNGVFNDPKKVGRGYKLVNVLDMYIDTVIDETKLSLVDVSENEFLKNKVENGDIFFTRSSLVKSGIAYSNIYTGNSSDITFDGHLIRFRPNKSILSPMFANYLLRTSKVRSQLIARGKSATMTTIGQADVAGVKLTVPKIINEQEKIASCLSSIDNLITEQTQKLETLKAHKKGLMQQLFPATEADSE